MATAGLDDAPVGVGAREGAVMSIRDVANTRRNFGVVWALRWLASGDTIARAMARRSFATAREWYRRAR